MSRAIPLLTLPLLLGAAVLLTTVPTDVQLPGTQPGEVGGIGAVSHCDNCHGGYDAAVEPAWNWRGSMMAHSTRDPLFWASVAIAEQGFPAAGDLCLRCHSPRGWLEGRSSPTDGSALTSSDADGTECAICHLMVDPDDGEHLGIQFPPFVAHDGGSPPEGYYGSGMMVLWGGNELLGPYTQTSARHQTLPSRFHRSVDFCGTCHDVSNPVTGDLAPRNGAQVPLAPGTFSGQPGGPVTSKAAFNNFPHQYGVVERTFSEFKASAYPSLRVADYPTLPAVLQDGALAVARQAALAAGQGGDYADGTPRVFSCQTCHMRAVTGPGCNKSGAPVRADLPLHDLTGGSTWMPELIRYLDDRGKLRLGGGMDAVQKAALRAGIDRARQNLRLAARLDLEDDEVEVVNLTGHKLISGYPEGRRMWLRTTWRDATGSLLREDGAYGTLSVRHRGAPLQVETLLDPSTTRVYEAHHGISRDWAQKLLGLGLSANMVLAYDRTSGAPIHTLGDLAAQPTGTAWETFHFVLNDTVIEDRRIPPYGMRYDDARQRNILPVPAGQYGAPAPGGTFEHADEVALAPPAGAAYALVELLYQSTSWEYVQFLDLANRGTSSFLATAGADLLDGWLNTGMAPPEVMTEVVWCALPGTGEDLALHTGVAGRRNTDCGHAARTGEVFEAEVRSDGGTFAGAITALVYQVHDPAVPPVPLAAWPGIQLSGIDGSALFVLPSGGAVRSWILPASAAGSAVRFQAIALSPAATNGRYAASPAHELLVRESW